MFNFSVCSLSQSVLFYIPRVCEQSGPASLPAEDISTNSNGPKQDSLFDDDPEDLFAGKHELCAYKSLFLTEQNLQEAALCLHVGQRLFVWLSLCCRGHRGGFTGQSRERRPAVRRAVPRHHPHHPSHLRHHPPHWPRRHVHALLLRRGEGFILTFYWKQEITFFIFFKFPKHKKHNFLSHNRK